MEFFQNVSHVFTTITFESWLFFVLVIVIYIGITIGLDVLAKHHNISIKVVRFLKWFFLLISLYVLEYTVLPKMRLGVPEEALLFVKVIVIWFVVIQFLDGCYAEIYIKKIKHEQVNHIFIDLIKLLIFIVLVVVLLKNTFDIDPSSILTSSAILTAVIGFAMQDTIGSLISGLLIQIEKPFAIGDWIAVATHEGKVVEISWRYTKIKTISRDYVLIPNNSISRDTLVNFNRPIPYVRQQIEIGVDFSVPPVRVKMALMEVLEKSSSILKNPSPIIRLMEYGPYRMQYRIIFYVPQFEAVRRAIDEINTSIWYQFRKEHIPIPYPQSELAVRDYQQPADETSAIVEMLQEISLFKGMLDDNLDLLVRTSCVKNFMQDQFIVRKGSTDTTLFVLLAGKVAVEYEGRSLTEFEAGNFFGEMALLTGQPRSADIKAVQAARCLVIDREGFRMILSKSPKIYENIQTMFHERMLDRDKKGMLHAKKMEGTTLLERFRQIFIE